MPDRAASHGLRLPIPFRVKWRLPPAVRSRSRRSAGLVAATALLSGCAPAGAPAIPFFGAYFPSWLACALAGILGAVAVRLLFVRMGIDDALPFRLPIYVSLAAGIGFLLSIISFGR